MSDNEQPAAPALNLEESDIITLNDVLQTEKQLYEDAYAVLGASDDSNCTYSEGYLKRQALYSCLTCIPEAKTDETKRAGVCLACCYHCHDGHELVELYTKRNFRCDCGNSKFTEHSCSLFNEKDEINALNEYNQNFAGLYCICHRPYPDPEDTVSDEMIQCVVCEDWFHLRHLDTVTPEETYSEMICKPCVEKHEFLRCYDHLTTSNKTKETTEENKQVDVENIGDKDTEKAAQESEEIVCKLAKSPPQEAVTKFYKNVSWREELCKCASCLKMYAEQNVIFLLDSKDTVLSYEEKGKAKALENEKTLLEDQSKLLNSLDRAPLLETISAYNDMKQKLSDYLKTFAENKRVVREEDIREFFSDMERIKRQKTES